METVDLVLLGLTGSRSALIEALEVFEKQNAVLIRRVERLEELCKAAFPFLSPNLTMSAKEFLAAMEIVRNQISEALKEEPDSVG